MKDILKNLDKKQRNQLIEALEHSNEFAVEVGPDLYIGVCIGTGYEVLETSGHFFLCRRTSVETYNTGTKTNS